MLSTPPIPPATLPPPHRPRIAHDVDDGDTVEERLDDTFDRTLAAFLAPPAPARFVVNARAMYETFVEDVVERVDDAMRAALEQRVVAPLYFIGGAVAVRTMLVPALLLFAAGVALGTWSAEVPHKTFPKAAGEVLPMAAEAREGTGPQFDDPEPRAADAEPATTEATMDRHVGEPARDEPATSPATRRDRRRAARRRAVHARRVRVRARRRAARRARQRRR